MKCEISKLQKISLYGGIIIYVILSTSIFMIVGEITIKSILTEMIAVVLTIFICKLCYYIELIDDKHIIAKNIMRTYSFTCDDVLNVEKYKIASVILIKYKHGSIMLLMKMRNVYTLVNKISN